MKLSNKINIFLLSAGLSLSCFMVFSTYHYLRLEAKNLAEVSLLSIADRRIASAIYFETVSRPKLIETLKTANAGDHFDPSLLSGTFISRSQQEIYDFVSGGHFQVRTFAVNARTPEHEASETEQSFLSELNNNRELEFKSYEQDINGKSHLVLLHRNSVQEESCLECHGEPEDAHSDLIKTYGNEKGFNRKVGEVVSGLSVTVPLKDFYIEAHRQAFKLSNLLVGGLAVLLVLCSCFAKRFILTHRN
jgi:Protein of unknown function (DUF3365)